MEIIHKGKDIAKCSKCKCVMAYDITDVKKDRIETYPSSFFLSKVSWRDADYIYCPNCGNKIITKIYDY